MKIVSGGQTGVDRGALDAGIALGLDIGGWCPRDRRAEDGTIPNRYPLRETPLRDYPQRTEWNVRDSDLTLILSPTPLSGGTRMTADIANRLAKPWAGIDPFEDDAGERIAALIVAKRPHSLNVAGPRESGCPGIQQRVTELLTGVLDS